MKTLTMALTILPAAIMTSCSILPDCIDGNGIVRSEVRTASQITAIANETSFDIVFVKGNETSLVVEAESNILPYIETEIKDNALNVSTVRGGWCLRYTSRPVITVTAPFISELVNAGSGDIIAGDLEAGNVRVIDSGSGDITTGSVGCTEASFIVSGSGNISSDAIDASSFRAVISGSGTLTIKGVTTISNIIVSGSGSLFGRELESSESQITISGSGSVYLTVLEYLEAVLSGSGNIYLSGEPSISLTRTGSGKIIKL